GRVPDRGAARALRGQRPRAADVPRGRLPRQPDHAGANRMTMNFGGLPVRASFTLSNDSDFYQVVKTSDGTVFPETAVMELRWLNGADEVITTWSATFADDTATF